MSGVVISGDTSGAVTLAVPAVAGTNTVTIPATTGTAVVMPTGYTLGAGNTSRFKNRIINGDMRIDQRNAGASLTPTSNGQYSLDRWSCSLSQASKYSVQQNAGSLTPVATTGFTNYLGITSLSAYSVNSTDFFILRQNIEGLNVADLAWGTANAKTVTLSFWVYSSLTGTFGGALNNSAETRSYPFTYSIPIANTWTQISITIAGDTTGTWLTTNGVGIRLNIGLGVGTTNSGTAGSWAGSAYYSATGAVSVVGTSGATFYITGVQLEVGSTASSFEYLDYTTQLSLCQRYYEISYTAGVKPGTVTDVGMVTLMSTPTGYPNYGVYPSQVNFNTAKRTSASITIYSNTSGASGNYRTTNPASDYAASVVTNPSTQGFTAYTGANVTNTGSYLYFQWAASAEL